MKFWRHLEDEDRNQIQEENIVEFPFRAFDLIKFKEKVEASGVLIFGFEFNGNNVSLIGAKKSNS